MRQHILMHGCGGRYIHKKQLTHRLLSDQHLHSKKGHGIAHKKISEEEQILSGGSLHKKLSLKPLKFKF